MQKEAQKEWLVIVNPNAGKRKGKKDWPEISSLLRKHGLPFTAVFTTGRHHAIRIAKDQIEKGYRNLIVVGGDGTMNEVINGVFLQQAVPTEEITVGMITVGTGNDWGRMFRIPRNYEDAIRTIAASRTFIQDAGVVNYFNDSIEQKRYFINMAGIGFDAYVVKRSNRLKDKGRSGTFLYLYNIFTSLFRYRHSHASVDVDGQQIKDSIFSISIGIGKYCGGGMMQTPQAIANDGLFDVTMIKKIGRINVIRSIGQLYNGRIIHHPRVATFKGRYISIDSEKMIHVEADGESLGHTPFRFEIIPSAIRVIAGDTYEVAV